MPLSKTAVWPWTFWCPFYILYLCCNKRRCPREKWPCPGNYEVQGLVPSIRGLHSCAAIPAVVLIGTALHPHCVVSRRRSPIVLLNVDCPVCAARYLKQIQISQSFPQSYHSNSKHKKLCMLYKRNNEGCIQVHSIWPRSGARLSHRPRQSGLEFGLGIQI